jgi:hypothetical protein
LATKTSFTPEQWNEIVNLPAQVAAFTSAIDFGIFTSLAEIKVIVTLLEQARTRYKSTLVRTMINYIELAPKSEDRQAQVQQASEFFDPKQASTPQVAIERMSAQVARVLEIVAGKATESEVAEFKDFILFTANSVANAAKEGFLGRGGPVSKKEAAFLEALRRALNL